MQSAYTCTVYILFLYARSEKSTTVWDVMTGAHKGKNLFDILIKVEPVSEEQFREPSLISLSSRTMQDLKITFVTERPFECSQENFEEEEFEESLSTGADDWEGERGGIADHTLDGAVSRGLNGGENARQHEGSSAVVVEVVMEENIRYLSLCNNIYLLIVSIPI